MAGKGLAADVRTPLTVTQQAWTLNFMGLAGVGALAGAIARGGLALASRGRNQRAP